MIYAFQIGVNFLFVSDTTRINQDMKFICAKLIILVSQCSVSNYLHCVSGELIFSEKSFDLNVERGYCNPTGLKVS